MSTLEEAIRTTETCLTSLLDTVDPQCVRVAWTGGKDSTVVLFIWKAILDHHGLGPVRAINLDTGCKFQEILDFRDRLAALWDVDLHIAKPTVELKKYPVAEDPLTCCRDLKVEPLKSAVRATGATHLLSGIRADEHPDRAGRAVIENREDPPHTLINPILHFTETDIWASHALYNIPHCELYDQGYRSLGCRPCTSKPDETSTERSGRDQSKEAVITNLTSLGYF